VSPARDELVARVTRNLAVVRERIAATGRDPAGVRIVAVTKTFGPEAAIAALAAGLCDVGENYADELVASYNALHVDTLQDDAVHDGALVWHFLGRLQRNKLARLAPRVAVYQTVSSAGEADAIASRAPGARCYVQVDVAGVPGRNGCRPDEVHAVASAALDAGLELEGLMCVASNDPSLADAQFAALRRAADDEGLTGCSMGMSGDFEAACARGATMIRLGTALFGPRPSRASPVVA
jgi:hypothetical protein